MKNFSIKQWSGRVAGGIAAVALVAGFAAAPASAEDSRPDGTSPAADSAEYLKPAKPAKKLYLALGDSYAAGTGGGQYVLPPAGLPAQCLQTAAAYPALRGAALNLGCFGATTIDVANAAAMYREAMASAKVVTVTVGGNDIDSGAVALTCTVAADSPECRAALYSSLTVKLPELPGKIRTMVAAIRDSAPHAKIVLTGYPRLFTLSAGLTAQQAQTATAMNAASDLLNATIAASARASKARYVSVTERFAGHGIGSADPWIVAPAGLCFDGVNCSPSPADTFHPTATGYSMGYAAALPRVLFAARVS